MRLFVTMLALALAIVVAAPKAEATGPVETLLYSFTSTNHDGESPRAALIQGSDGYLYGTTAEGGTSGNGTIFKIAVDGSGYQVIHDFAGGTSDGSTPTAALVQASDGNLYGTTASGGQFGDGVLFEIATGGTGYQVLHSFGATTSDGQSAFAGLIQASDGSLYGATAAGGTHGDGTVYRVGLGGSNYQVIESFGATATDANGPVAPLYQAPDGYLYGTAEDGGANGLGAIFKILPNGTSYQVIYSFAGGTADGASPAAPVVEASDGALYGITTYGGTGATVEGTGNGVIFKIDPDGSNCSVVHFLSSADGINPVAGLIAAPDGYLYGTTQGSSGATYGAIIRIAVGGGNFSVEYEFAGLPNDGSDPLGSMCLASNGELYGTTASAGQDNEGIVYSLQVPGLAAGPTGLSAVAGDEQVGLSWNVYPGASSYNIYRGTSPGGEDGTPIASVSNGASYINSGLTNGTSYYYKVTAVVSSIETALSAEVAATPATQTVLHTYDPGLQMISAPADYTGFAPWQVFDEGPITLAAWNGTFYAVSTISPITIQPGHGYWVRFAAQADMLDIGVDETAGQPVSLSLQQGWSLIGNPHAFTQAISGLSVQVGTNTYSFLNANKAGYIGATFYTWQPGDTTYEMLPASTGTLDPYLGYWIYVFQPCTLIFPGQT